MVRLRIATVLLMATFGSAQWTPAEPPATQPGPTTQPIVLGVNDPFCKQTGSACVGADRYREYVGLAKRLGDGLGRRVELRYFFIEGQLNRRCQGRRTGRRDRQELDRAPRGQGGGGRRRQAGPGCGHLHARQWVDPPPRTG